MKIIHCADIHADSAMKGHFSKLASQRREEIVDAFGRMVDFAQKNGVSAIIISGDLFDTGKNQHKTLKNRLFYIISNHPQIDFLYLRGNHDEAFYIEETYPNLKLFSKDGWISYSYGQVEISGREFGASIPASAYSQLKLDAGKTNIVMLHGQLADYAPKEDAPVISLPKLVNQNIDYLALGHIHNFRLEKLDSRGVWCYPGCLEGRGFDECGEKGFVLLTIEDGKVETQFIRNSQRVIHEIEVPLSGTMTYNEILKACAQRTAAISPKDIVQIDLKGEISEDTEIESDSYEAALASNFYFIRFKNQTEPKIDYEKYEKDVSLKGEFIRLVKAQKELSEEEKSKIIMTGIRALAGRMN